MIRGMLLLAVIMIISTQALAGDEYPKAEAFGGFSLLSLKGSAIDRFNPAGFQANAAFNFHKNLGVVADFGGHYRHNESSDPSGTGTWHMHEFLFGPRYTHRMEKVNVFGQALFGGVNIGVKDKSKSAFAMGFGGGIDITLTGRLALRAVQFDWIPFHYYEAFEKNCVRFGFGVVIR